MTGGRGTRLHGLTEFTPKTLLHVGAKPMLQTVLESFVEQGFRKFWFCVNYRKDAIENHFGNGSRWGVSIKYTHEETPMGTGGAINLLPEFKTPFIVQNGDVLAPGLKYPNLMEYHARSNADATVCAALHQHQIEYGLLDYDETGLLKGVREKPIENFAVNAGIYVIGPEARKQAPSGAFNMPDLTALLGNVSVYEIEGPWWDLGRFEDLAKANAEWTNGKDFRAAAGDGRGHQL